MGETDRRENQIEQNVIIAISLKEHPHQLCTSLMNHGLSVIIAQDVQTVFQKLKAHTNTFLILDLSLEGAISLMKKILNTFYNPPPYIIAIDFFPYSHAQADILNLGADVCLEKPLDFEEIFAVINAALRRMNRLTLQKQSQSASHIGCSSLDINPLCRSVCINGRLVSLTVKEFDILHFLASHPGVVFSKAQIYERVWNNDYQFATTSVSDHISSLRKKLGLNPRDGRYIQTVHGAGYRFVKSK